MSDDEQQPQKPLITKFVTVDPPRKATAIVQNVSRISWIGEHPDELRRRRAERAEKARKQPECDSYE